MKANFKNVTFILATIAFSICPIISCKKDKSSNTNNNPPPTTTENYILFGGIRIKMINPKIGSIQLFSGDTALVWAGNKPGGIGDTTLTIIHPVKRTAGKPTVLDPQAVADKEVAIFLRWGVVAGQPFVSITGGDYLLTRVNNKWVSTLKNGVGEWTPSGGPKQTFTGIEFRVEWPD